VSGAPPPFRFALVCWSPLNSNMSTVHHLNPAEQNANTSFDGCPFSGIVRGECSKRVWHLWAWDAYGRKDDKQGEGGGGGGLASFAVYPDALILRYLLVR
jgi:hypothetical protein